jgi:hypothetical protein
LIIFSVEKIKFVINKDFDWILIHRRKLFEYVKTYKKKRLLRKK